MEKPRQPSGLFLPRTLALRVTGAAAARWLGQEQPENISTEGCGGARCRS